MAIIVGSFTLQLPTSASVTTLLAFAKPWQYCMSCTQVFQFYWILDMGGASLIRDLGGNKNT